MLHKDDLLDIVTSDLVFLREEWDEEVDDHSLRRSSTILRRLLVDNELQRAWKAAHFEKEPIIEASTLQKIIEVTPLAKVVFAAAGGARYKGAELHGVIMRNYVLTPEEIKKESEHGVLSASFGLRAFIEAPCVIIKQNLISRRILIKYVSNKLGGAHHDSRRGKTKEELLFSLLDGTQQYRLISLPCTSNFCLPVRRSRDRVTSSGSLPKRIRMLKRTIQRLTTACKITCRKGWAPETWLSPSDISGETM